MLLARDSDDTGNQVLLRVLGSRWARRTSSVWQANLNKFIGMFYRRISQRRKMNRKENRDSWIWWANVCDTLGKIVCRLMSLKPVQQTMNYGVMRVNVVIERRRIHCRSLVMVSLTTKWQGCHETAEKRQPTRKHFLRMSLHSAGGIPFYSTGQCRVGPYLLNLETLEPVWRVLFSNNFHPMPIVLGKKKTNLISDKGHGRVSQSAFTFELIHQVKRYKSLGGLFSA